MESQKTQRERSSSDQNDYTAGSVSHDQLEEPTESNAMTGQFSPEAGIHALSEAISYDAISSSLKGYPPSTSLPKTRSDILRQIQDWIEAPRPSSNVLWLYGSAGVGKTASAQTIAELCRTTDRLAASFFFRRQNGYDQSRHLVTTIAYQLAMNIPGLLAQINHIMSVDPTLPNKAIDVQFQSLVVGPFQHSTSIPLRSSIIVVDALDECNGEETQSTILALIANAVEVYKLPLRFLITSRPELHIREAFDREPLFDVTRRIFLGDSFHSSDTETSLPSNLQNSHTDSSRPFLGRFLHPSRRRHGSPTNRIPFSMDSFPKLVTVQRSNGYAESYSRSMMMKGHGFPVWYPGGDLGKPVKYLQKGLSIGDVGILDREGTFDFCFNIFLQPDDPIHARLVPREFRPIQPPLDPSEIRCTPEFFKNGAVITSKGVTITRHSESPLDISFSSMDQEGGILILPEGASREDLIATERFHEYAKKNAPHWYQVINGYGGVVHTNGSLFLVTGCDKAKDWASASFPYHAGDTETRIDLRYTWQPEYGPPWIDNGTARTRFYAPPNSKTIPADGDTKNQCVFVRGMRISLSETAWGMTMPRLKSARLYYTYILHKPSSLELWLNTVLVYLRLRLSERKAMKKVTSSRLQLFHPNFVIGQVLLGMSPDAEVALVDDSVWCSLTDSGYCTLSEINELVATVFDTHNIVEKNGIVTLVSKPTGDYGTMTSKTPVAKRTSWPIMPLLPKFLKQNPEKKDIHWVKAIPVADHAKLF